MDRCNSIMKLALQICAESVIFCILLCWSCFQMTSWDLFGDLVLWQLKVLLARCSPIPQFLPVIQSQTQLSHIDSAACLFLSYFIQLRILFSISDVFCLLLTQLQDVGSCSAILTAPSWAGSALLLCWNSRMLSQETFPPNSAFVCVAGKPYHSKVGINLSSY